MTCFIPFARLLFPHLLRQRIIQHIQFRILVSTHAGCNRLVDDAYSTMTTDPVFTFVGVRINLTLYLKVQGY
jgi:hypothetical protein